MTVIKDRAAALIVVAAIGLPTAAAVSAVLDLPLLFDPTISSDHASQADLVDAHQYLAVPRT